MKISAHQEVPGPLTARLSASARDLRVWASVALLASVFSVCGNALAATEATETATSTAPGPVRLVAPAKGSAADSQLDTTLQLQRENLQLQQQLQEQQQLKLPLTAEALAARNAMQTEFERHVQRIVGDDVEIRRFGWELMTPGGRAVGGQVGEASSQVPQDYQVAIGDEVVVTLWGAVEADLRLTVDRSGRITIPRVGPVLVAGVRYADLNATIDQRVAQVFRNYRLSASLGKLRSIRVYVTGFTKRPGALVVSSLSTVMQALMQAGGPSPAGSFRNIELRRAGKLVGRFDLYDLLLRGDGSQDRVLQPDDVVHIGPVGAQVALIGSVNRQGIFELKSGETVSDLLAMGGGLNAVAERSRIAVESMDLRNDARVAEVALPAQGNVKLSGGDVVRAFNALDAVLPQHRQNKRVRVEGEVQRPGDYILPPSSTLADVIKAAGGLTPGAFVYGTEFNRESVRITQQSQYERALRDLETEFARVQLTQKALTTDEAGAQAARGQNSTRLIERLRAVRPTGRIVLQLSPTATALPDLAVEDGDRLVIPPVPTSVGVFGSVFNGGSFVFNKGASIDDMLRLAGGPTRGADSTSTFVIRANGSVVSAKQQTSGWLTLSSGLSALPALPGDTVFVPEDLNKTSFSQEAKEWTQILYQFGLGAAALKTIKN
ncbi:SLBB domain-containing protein [Roseateles sp. BYS87W]|uniref:SLBB domain-containing protein n=1 Tax=Pelomonas baiyunensis TaxID=3299026 RepID=A0ABW7H3Q3_9BURK